MVPSLKGRLSCGENGCAARSSAGRELYQNALEWIEDQGTGWLFSFNNICGLLGFDPDYMREFLLKREQKLARPVRGKVYTFAAQAAAD